MKIDLEQILALAGDLEQEGSRKRFQSFLADVAKDSDSIRELLAASALKVSDLQHRHALQDLVLSLGVQLGFEPGLSFGGHWRSPAGVIFLLELVGGDDHLDIAALVGRAESLASPPAAPPAGEGAVDEEVAEEASALCLLVVGDSEILRVENAIIEGDEEGRLRAISISALLALSKIVEEYHLTHDDVLVLLLTSGPSVDPIVDLIARVISQCEAETPTLEEIAQILGPLGRGGEPTPEGALQDLIDQSQYYAFGYRGAGQGEKRR
ncbi:hypothetical protein [Methanocrinis sp.]|uniref:hypothetical protein n=1 Tax=Methanocrinis sp. TaxID=3101522 RepID=UPI003D0D88CB